MSIKDQLTTIQEAKEGKRGKNALTNKANLSEMDSIELNRFTTYICYCLLGSKVHETR